MEATVKNKPVEVHDSLKKFAVHHTQSSFIGYFATNKADREMVVQFKTGECVLFSEVPEEVIDAATKAESIGKFFHAHIKGHYPVFPLEKNLIQGKQA